MSSVNVVADVFRLALGGSNPPGINLSPLPPPTVPGSANMLMHSPLGSRCSRGVTGTAGSVGVVASTAATRAAGPRAHALPVWMTGRCWLRIVRMGGMYSAARGSDVVMVALERVRAGMRGGERGFATMAVAPPLPLGASRRKRAERRCEARFAVVVLFAPAVEGVLRIKSVRSAEASLGIGSEMKLPKDEVEEAARRRAECFFSEEKGRDGDEGLARLWLRRRRERHMKTPAATPMSTSTPPRTPTTTPAVGKDFFVVL